VSVTDLDGVDLLCLSHLRWDQVFQRPQHLMVRHAGQRRVYFIEEPRFDENVKPHCTITLSDGVRIVTPWLPQELSARKAPGELKKLLDELMRADSIDRPILWYYTPIALTWSKHVDARVIVYDCMDELANFKSAASDMRQRESQLLERADLVLTGGWSLYDAKKTRHRNVHALPSSVDTGHFGAARHPMVEPADQAHISHPRLGFCGVIDERMDLQLLAAIADARTAWHIVLIGPIAKIAPESIPKRQNIHLLGPRRYEELPVYISGWDVALLPFARNEATRFISPTKTPEYLAAGRPVVSTSIPDVVRPYGEAGLIRIADTPDAFVRAIEASFGDTEDQAWIGAVDNFLNGMSWDRTFGCAERLMIAAYRQRLGTHTAA
jgi:UDP-galactopyranose mutase